MRAGEGDKVSMVASLRCFMSKIIEETELDLLNSIAKSKFQRQCIACLDQ